MANPETCPPEATFALSYPVLGTYTKAMDIGGVFTPGGCLSNTVALLAAREKCFPGSRLRGIPVLLSKIRILQDKDIWFHVDACHGSQLAFSKHHHYKLRGIEKADSITIDPQQTMLVPYDCALVLFREPGTQAALSTDSDSISNAQLSFGWTGPVSGSKAFNSLKVWSFIKRHGKNSMGWMIDERLKLTNAIQLEVEHRPNLILLGGTDINSCMLVYVPANADLEKVNQLNLHIQDVIHREHVYYIHGFPLGNCPHGRFIEPGKKVFVLRTLNGNPQSTMDNVRGLLSKIEHLGQVLFTDSQHICMGDTAGSSANRLQRAERKLTQKLYNLFDNNDFAAVVYGSSALQSNAILSNIDLMVFAHSAKSSKIQEVVSVFRSVMEAEGILIDFEIPLHRRLLVTFGFASQAANSGPPLDETGHVSSISNTPEDLEMTAARKLVNVIQRFGLSETGMADEFVKLAISDGGRREGKDLGYKPRCDVLEKLRKIFHHVQNAPLE
ncbi:pyridoxal phosphate-dependent transferase [Fusarium sp. MPI-SDFR-AT-0072]|nr:pyridoxal phosphate-dependent transferase [Fusarium sp. MPI-SDFR-AT-0072]